jgi:lipooligosaccharide transport system permease protein
MNGAIYDATTNVFWKLRYGKVYDSMLATPLSPVDVAVGETSWAQFRGGLYACGFIVTALALGTFHSWWSVFALPAALVIGFGFAGVGIGVATFLRSWQDFELVQIVLLPMFLFSGTFYPLSVYPDWLAWLVRFSPLYNAISLIRSFTLGHVTWYCLLNVAYLVVLGVVGIALARRRMAGLLLT